VESSNIKSMKIIMKTTTYITIVIGLILILGTTGCSNDNAESNNDTQQADGLIGIALQLHQNSPQ